MAEGMDMIRRITPEEEYNAGLTIFRQGGVHPLEEENGFLRYAVDGDPRRIVRVGADLLRYRQGTVIGRTRAALRSAGAPY